MSLQLAITTIGDLLLENRISRNDENKVIPDVRLRIPDYQRPYKWTVKNVLQLTDDIIEAKFENKEIYRVGTLILHHNAELGGYDIVDGQQRTISFCLLLKALERSPGFLDQEIEDNPYSVRNLKNNYRALTRKVGNIPDDRNERQDFLEYVTGQCELIVVITDDLSEAFQFFDSQNARGRKLYPHDLLKAYHLREMNDLGAEETEKVVRDWEDRDQRELSSLLCDYLYRLKEWIKGNRAYELSEHNIDKFKGITRQENFPYAQFFKGAFAYADMVNRSAMPFVSGMRGFNPFQIAAPIIAGKPFFDYTKHYFDILKDIRNNDKFEGYYINDNVIVKTLDRRKLKNGVGNRITRLLFDTAILLYIDRFCPERSSKNDNEMLDQFVKYAFIWAYSLRAQYWNLGWLSAQNYILGRKSENTCNAFNIYKVIADADSPSDLQGTLADLLVPLPREKICDLPPDIDEQDDGVYKHYLHFFKENHFLEEDE